MPLSDIEWTKQAEGNVADVFNGNHHYQMILEQLADTLKQKEELEKKMEDYEVKHGERGIKATKAQSLQHMDEIKLLDEVMTLL